MAKKKSVPVLHIYSNLILYYSKVSGFTGDSRGREGLGGKMDERKGEKRVNEMKKGREGGKGEGAENGRIREEKKNELPRLSNIKQKRIGRPLPNIICIRSLKLGYPKRVKIIH